MGATIAHSMEYAAFSWVGRAILAGQEPMVAIQSDGRRMLCSLVGGAGNVPMPADKELCGKIVDVLIEIARFAVAEP